MSHWQENANGKWDQSLLDFASSLLFMAGTVKVWDPRQKDDPVANMEPAQGENKRDCWTVAFGRLLKRLLHLNFRKFPVVSRNLFYGLF